MIELQCHSWGFTCQMPGDFLFIICINFVDTERYVIKLQSMLIYLLLAIWHIHIHVNIINTDFYIFSGMTMEMCRR